MEERELREALLMGFHQIYMQMITYVQKINPNPQLNAYFGMNIDQAAFWARQAIESVHIEKPTPAPVAPPSDSSEPVDNVDKIGEVA